MQASYVVCPKHDIVIVGQHQALCMPIITIYAMPSVRESSIKSISLCLLQISSLISVVPIRSCILLMHAYTASLLSCMYQTETTWKVEMSRVHVQIRSAPGVQEVLPPSKDRCCTSALLMPVCIHSWPREIQMIYLHFSSIWDSIKHWCWYPGGNVDRIAFLPTVYLPAASSVGSMHQNRPDMMWLFICRLWNHTDIKSIMSSLPLSLFCPSLLALRLSLPLSFSKPRAYNLSSGETVSLSFAIMVEHIFVISTIKRFSIKRLHIIQWPWLHAARLLMSLQQMGCFFFLLFFLLFLLVCANWAVTRLRPCKSKTSWVDSLFTCDS